MTFLLILVIILLWMIRVYTWILWARFILDWVRVFNPRFRPTGFWVIPVETVYAATDPPIKMFRKILPPIRLGQVSLDLGWMLTLLTCLILLAVIPLLVR